MTYTDESGVRAFAGSVSDRILAQFIVSVASEAELAPVAARLKDSLLEKRLRSEASLRAALFGEEEL